MSKAIDVVSLYPKDMNIYGDSGNVLAVERGSHCTGTSRMCMP